MLEIKYDDEWFERETAKIKKLCEDIDKIWDMFAPKMMRDLKEIKSIAERIAK